jgi:hypothetical protein
MTPMSPEEINQNYKNKSDINGIIVYRPRQLIEVDEYTQINVPGAGAGASATVSSACTPSLVRKLVTVVDWDHPYRLHYDHGILETYTFGATVTSDGVLTVINSQSTPDQGKTLSNLASVATSAASIARAPAPPGSPPCTITPAFVDYESPPSAADIKGFGTTVAP